MKQTMVVDSEFIDMISPEGFEEMVIRNEDIERHGGSSLGESTLVYVLKTVARHLCDGSGIAILDCVVCGLTREKSVELLSILSYIGLEQIILLEPRGFDRSHLERFNANVIELQYPRVAD